LFDRDRDGEVRDAVQEVGGAVQRINDPARLALPARDLTLFFKQKPIIGARLLEDFLDRPFGRAVGIRHEIGRAFARHLQLFDLVEVAAQARGCLAGGLVHDGDEGAVSWHS
jgi:hypothetical protein